MAFGHYIKRHLYRPDLLGIYVRNTNFSYVAAGVFLLVFGYVNMGLYSTLGNTSLTMLGGLLLATAFFFILYKRKCKKLLLNSQSLHKHFLRESALVFLLKTIVILGLLTIFFWPFQKTSLLDEIIGITAASCLLVLFSSVGSAYFPFLVFDALLIAGYVAVITRFTVPPSIIGTIDIGIVLFTTYALILGRIINRSTLRILDDQKKLKIASDKTQSAYKAKSEFLATMSHEIRTPMNGIMGMLDFLGDTPLSKEQKEYVQAIEYCSKTLLNTLNDILDISRMEAGKLAISKIQVNLHELLAQIEMVYARNALAKGLSFSLNTSPDTPEFIIVDPNRLSQIIANLLNNALKFTDKGYIHLDVSLNPQDRMLHFSVKDTGTGIREADQKALFKRFSQVDSSIARKYGGTGLGLSIVYNLVRNMDGDIGVDSVYGQGSTFWFSIPCEQSLMPLPAADAEGPDAYDMEDLRGKNVLVVDDNDLNQTIVRKYLAAAGMSVSQAKSGWEAAEKVKLRRFDVILMDLQMPDMDGYQATRAIKGLEKGRDTVILALSANVLKETLQRCHEAGMAGHIGKPINKDELFRKLHKAVISGEDARAGLLNAIVNKNALLSIIEEFGPDYAENFVGESIGEIEKKMTALNIAIVNGQMDNARAIAHDLITLSGNIGMDMSSRTAETLEHYCINWDQAFSTATFTKLRKYIRAEAIEVRRICAEEGAAAL